MPALPSIELKSDRCSALVDPATLAVTLRTKDREPIPVSAPQAGLGTAEGVSRSGQTVRWTLPKVHLTVEVRLEGNALEIAFSTTQPGEVIWPIVPARKEVRGYILPTFEGVYAPIADPRWQDFLVERGAMTTTADLSMPFWGLDFGKQTLTYLLVNPFHNELTFRKEKPNLSARLTHSFTRNQKGKSFAVRVSLSGASPIEPARVYRNWLIRQGKFVPFAGKTMRVPDGNKLLGAAHIYLWGDGFSSEMVDALARNGFSRLWLGSGDWGTMRRNPTAVQKAMQYGYLVGPYDSYHSIHSPDAKPDDTWETAQFDRELYATGPIERQNGKLDAGFQGKGYHLSPLAARPYVEKRVTGLMREFRCNSWFVDCDAFGELYDDYSPLHPATQEMDMQARLQRMAWIRDTFRVVVGSEGGSAYAASTIHFAHGMMTPYFGWGDKDLKDRNSPYFMGGYYPPERPSIFFRQTKLKPMYYPFYFDPRYRLPLYQTVFHDSVITTHHWEMSSLKFSDLIRSRALMEILYGVPPLYNLDQQEFAKNREFLTSHYAFFSPLHREIGVLPLTDFTYLTSDHLVQRTRFGSAVEVIANLRSAPSTYLKNQLPAWSVLVRQLRTGIIKIYTPKASQTG